VTTAEIAAGSTGAPTHGRPRSSRVADRYNGSFRRQLRVVAIGLLMVNLALGLFARQQQHATIDHAINIYDTAFIATNYVHLAQMSFQRYVDDRIRAAGPIETSKANELLEKVLDEMDVAIERSSSPRSRALGLEIRANIAALPDLGANAPEVADRLTDIAQKMEQLGARNAAVGLMARDDIEEFSFKSDLLLLGSIVTSVMLAGLALLLLNRMINSMKQRSSAQLSAALEGMPQGLSMFDGEQQLIVCNANYAAMYRLPPEHTEPGTPLRTILEHRVATGTSPIDIENFVEETMASASGQTLGVAEQQLHDGRIVSVTSAPLSTGGRVTIHMDVTEKRNSEKQIAFLAHHDALTGLANRVQLRDHIMTSLKNAERGERFSVLCLDLDNFKDINDTLGHSVGDALLCAVSMRLRGLVRDNDLVSRTGGDEFSIVQPGTEQPVAAATDLATRIVEALSVPFDIGDHQVVVGASIGIALAPDDGNDADQLLKNADMALYRAKDDGRGGFHFFEPAMDAKAQARRFLELDLRKAINAGEFEVFYQPIVSARNHAISGFEALARWRHPVKGMVPPVLFIPVAEDSGLIVQLGEWALEQACRQAIIWPGDIKVAVNLSPVQFTTPNLVETVERILAETGLAPHRLELEITERIFMADNEDNLVTLRRLKALGVRIAMDDFGTGYSSLSYLRSFPFDKIKIDRTFVTDLAERNEYVVIVQAVVSIARALGMTTTAEGVETSGQYEFLKALGCDEVQGYLFSPPVAVDKLGELFAKWASGKNLAA